MAHASPTRGSIQDAVDRNYEAFTKLLPELLKTNPGQFALLRNGEIVVFFPTAREAIQHGENTFGDGLFSRPRGDRYSGRSWVVFPCQCLREASIRKSASS